MNNNGNDPVNYEDLMLRIDKDPTRYVRAYACYSLQAAADIAAVNGSASPSVKIDSASLFVWTKGAYFCDIAAGAQTDSSRVIPLMTVQLSDSGSERQLFDRAQPISSVFGTGEIPAILPVPYLFQKSSTLQALITNFSAATVYRNTMLTLIGYRVYDLKPNAG